MSLIMRGLLMLFAIFAFNLIAHEFPDGIPGSNLPKMRTGFSTTMSNTDIFNSACRRLVAARFSDNLRDADPEDRDKMLNQMQAIISPSEIAVANGENVEHIFTHMQHAATQEIKKNIILSLRNVIPEELILSSGFTATEQDPLDLAGCYIRLGKSLRDINLNTLAATSFLKSGLLFATIAQHDMSEQNVDWLTSAAQCYYWAYCNDRHSLRTAKFRDLANLYFDRANLATESLRPEEKIIWTTKIENEKARILTS